MRVKTAAVSHFKALDDEEGGEPEGTFEAIVSVFGNVDYAGDRVVKGAFAKSLATWAASGDPVPVIWSHQWQDPEMHIGGVLEAEERDEGLWVKAQLDVADDPVAAKVWRLLSTRRVREFSFAYDVLDEKQQNGANELLQLDVIEVGPTLKGMNPDTLLLEAKARRDARAARARDEEAPVGTDNAADEAADDATSEEAPGEAAELDDDGSETETGGTDATEGGAVESAEDEDEDAPVSGASARSGGRKARVTLDGSYEQLQERLRGAVTDWSAAAFPGADIFVAGLEATYPDHAVLYVETWDQPWGGGDYHQASWDLDSDGVVSLGDPEPVELIGVATPKSLPEAATAKKTTPAAAAAGASPESLLATLAVAELDTA